MTKINFFYNLFALYTQTIVHIYYFEQAFNLKNRIYRSEVNSTIQTAQVRVIITYFLKLVSYNVFFSVRFHIDEQNLILGKMVLVRNIKGFIITTALPSFLANIIGHMTNYFKEESFDAVIGVNLTILLVLTTM